MTLRAGANIAGKYRALRRVGAGAMGEVWQGERLSDRTKVALKTLLDHEGPQNNEIAQRFKREAYFLQRIQSDYVARVFDFVTDETFGSVLVMEFVEGTPLSSVLQRRTLSIEETIDVGTDIASALVDLHASRVVHRDLKPGNIIMKPLPDGRERAMVVDFGLSRLLSGGDEEADETLTGLTQANAALGTLEYMAPEQILNSRDVTAVSDIYAVGAILFRAAKGHHAFTSTNMGQLAQAKLLTEAPLLDTGRADAVAQGLARVVAKALKKLPKDRYTDAAVLLGELDDLRELVRGGEPGGAPEPDVEHTDIIPNPRASMPEMSVHELGDDRDEELSGEDAIETRVGRLDVPDGFGPPAAKPPAALAAATPAARARAADPRPAAASQGVQAAAKPKAKPPEARRSRGVPGPIAALGVMLGIAGGIAIGRATVPAGVRPTTTAAPPVTSPAATVASATSAKPSASATPVAPATASTLEAPVPP